MRAMILAFVAIGVIAVGADLVLGQMPFSSADQYVGEAVRLGE